MSKWKNWLKSFFFCLLTLLGVAIVAGLSYKSGWLLYLFVVFSLFGLIILNRWRNLLLWLIFLWFFLFLWFLVFLYLIWALFNLFLFSFFWITFLSLLYCWVLSLFNRFYCRPQIPTPDQHKAYNTIRQSLLLSPTHNLPKGRPKPQKLKYHKRQHTSQQNQSRSTPPNEITQAKRCVQAKQNQPQNLLEQFSRHIMPQEHGFRMMTPFRILNHNPSILTGLNLVMRLAPGNPFQTIWKVVQYLDFYVLGFNVFINRLLLLIFIERLIPEINCALFFQLFSNFPSKLYFRKLLL